MSPRRVRPLVAAVLLLGLTGCASAVDPIERLGRKTVEQVRERDAADRAHVRAERPRG
ncbi:hypothetical protein OG462_26525 [Streptomyces sp. NBC_01077]|uniref:hypothetical protein n=1 Tax=Streptomyces sp. NBC_01077 TaxID=2903746 RepID=UPI0038633D79|nr:hypothetical protein OG462_26525 [Streptomyces sp. NBC_01077]